MVLLPKDCPMNGIFLLPFFSILVVCVEKLKLDLIVESIQECILFPFVSINIIRCMP
jgi:hypothetical protein